jgi:hypothetical protein
MPTDSATLIEQLHGSTRPSMVAGWHKVRVLVRHQQIRDCRLIER